MTETFFLEKEYILTEGVLLWIVYDTAFHERILKKSKKSKITKSPGKPCIEKICKKSCKKPAHFLVRNMLARFFHELRV